MTKPVFIKLPPDERAPDERGDPPD